MQSGLLVFNAQHLSLWCLDGVQLSVYPEEVRQHHVILERPSPFKIQTAIVKSSNRLSTFKAGNCFDILRNESASTNKSSEHHGPWLAPHLVTVLVLCLLLYSSFELCTLRTPQGPAPVQDTKKSGSKMSLRLQKAMLVRSNYIPHTFNPCGDVTMSYLLWCLSTLVCG